MTSRLRRNGMHIVTLLSAQGVSSVGNYLFLVAINVLVLERTGSAVAVASLWTVQPIASLVVGGWMGSLTDRLNQRTLLAIVEILRGILIVTVPLFSEVGFIYAVLFVFEILGVAFSRAFLPYQTRLVPETKRLRVNGITQMLQSGAVLLGPALAGLILWHNRPNDAIWIDGATFILSAASFVLLPSFRDVPPSSDESSKLRLLREDWKSAVSFLRTHNLVLAVLTVIYLVLVIVEAGNSVEAVFASSALHLGRVGYSELTVASGIGLVVGSVVVTTVATRLKVRWLIVVGLITTSFAYLMYSFSTSLISAGLCLVGLGLFASMLGVGVGTYIQFNLPVEIMGRVMNVIEPIQSLMTVVLILGTGYISDITSVRISMIVITSLATVVALVACVFWMMPGHAKRFETT
ncbi:MFS transporter [Alicyclobacillus mengziensis]|uniref:MFS transporter n=1 Tax=Alicyclobacillus mengziensis TaxID=2931921 RepID=A0A9X7VZ08_9BACL|nr:MFS transporter [Alicyclobacillus mengziensis]QSO47339.1 MFS transporter [Alicyclobacillus mengziensis]